MQNRELVELLGGATAGLHSMIDEHFGIVVVEYMAAGAIPIGKLLEAGICALILAISSSRLESSPFFFCRIFSAQLRGAKDGHCC